MLPGPSRSLDAALATLACMDDHARPRRFDPAQDTSPLATVIEAEEWIRHGTPAFRRTNLALFAAGFATFGMLYCVQPLMPAFSRHYGISAAQSALSLSLTTGVLAFAMLIAGALSDAWGRKRVMVASLLASAMLVLLTATAPNWPSLLVLRSLLGLALSGLPAVAMTYLAEEVHPQSIGLGMGLYIAGSAVGGMGGRLISGVMADFFDWRIGVAAVGVIGVACSLAFTRALPASRRFAPQPLRWRAQGALFASLFRDRGLPWLFVEGFLLLGAFVTVYNYLGYRLLAAPYSLSQATVGLIFAIYLIGTFSSAWMGNLAGRLGRRKVLWSAFGLMLAGVLLTMAASLALIVAGIVAITFGFFGGHSIASSWVGRRAGAAKAQAAALYLFAYYMGSSVAGAGGGLFYATWGWTGVGGFVGAMVLAGLVIAAALYRLPPLAGAVTRPTPMSDGAMP